jgi:hypothetical protein
LSTDFLKEHTIRALEKNVEEISELSRWHVYEHYEIIFDEAGSRYIYAPRRIDGLDNKVVQRLQPLSRTSADLCLRFARWPEETRMDSELDTERNAEAALLWAKTFGVLGLNPADSIIHTLVTSQRVTADYLGLSWPDDTSRRRQNRPTGGMQNLPTGGMPEESVANFTFEAWEAHIVWRLYESVRTAGSVDKDSVIQFMSTIDHWEEGTTVMPSTEGELVPVEASWVEREIFSGDSELVRRWALTIVEDAVNMKIGNHCFPIVHGAPGSYKRDWGFRSLLGAMWLQMLFLMREDRRCWWCGKPLDPGRRSHARFCDNNGQCRSNWNYHSGEGKSSKERRRQGRYIG